MCLGAFLISRLNASSVQGVPPMLRCAALAQPDTGGPLVC